MEEKEVTNKIKRKINYFEISFVLILLLSILFLYLDYDVFKRIDTTSEKSLIMIMCYGLMIIFTLIIVLLVHKKKPFSSLIGIVISLVNIILGTIYIKILGGCLLIVSIIYMIKNKDAYL